LNVKLAAAFIVGIPAGAVIGSVIAYSYFSTTQKQETWRNLTSFVLASVNESMPANVEISYSHSNVYYKNGPLFNVKGSFWRVHVQTVPYYNFTNGNDSMIIYYNQAPINNIRIWRDTAYVNNPFSSIVMLDPTYDYGVATSGTAQAYDQYFYVSWKEEYVPVETTLNFAGTGNYVISLDTGVGCFNFTIEEYR
jgi:hypothetical protein